MITLTHHTAGIEKKSAASKSVEITSTLVANERFFWERLEDRRSRLLRFPEAMEFPQAGDNFVRAISGSSEVTVVSAYSDVKTEVGFGADGGDGDRTYVLHPAEFLAFYPTSLENDQVEFLLSFWEFLNALRSNLYGDLAFGFQDLMESVYPPSNTLFPTVPQLLLDEICCALTSILLHAIKQETPSNAMTEIQWQDLLASKPTNVLTWPVIAHEMLRILPVRHAHVEEYDQSLVIGDMLQSLVPGSESHFEIFALLMAHPLAGPFIGLEEPNDDEDRVEYEQLLQDRNSEHMNLLGVRANIMHNASVARNRARMQMAYEIGQVGGCYVDRDIADGESGFSVAFSEVGPVYTYPDDQFVSDVHTVFANAVAFYPPLSELAKAAQTLLVWFDSLVSRYDLQTGSVRENDTYVTPGSAWTASVAHLLPESVLAPKACPYAETPELTDLLCTLRCLGSSEPDAWSKENRISILRCLQTTVMHTDAYRVHQIRKDRPQKVSYTLHDEAADRVTDVNENPNLESPQNTHPTPFQPYVPDKDAEITCYLTGTKTGPTHANAGKLDWVILPQDLLLPSDLALQAEVLSTSGSGHSTSIDQVGTLSLIAVKSAAQRAYTSRKVALLSAARLSEERYLIGTKLRAQDMKDLQTYQSPPLVPDRLPADAYRAFRNRPLGHDRYGFEYWIFSAQFQTPLLSITGKQSKSSPSQDPCLLVRDPEGNWAKHSGYALYSLLQCFSESIPCERALKDQISEAYFDASRRYSLGALKCTQTRHEWLKKMRRNKRWLSSASAQFELTHGNGAGDEDTVKLINIAYARCMETRTSLHYAVLTRDEPTEAIEQDGPPAKLERETINKRRKFRDQSMEDAYDFHYSKGWLRKDALTRVRELGASTIATKLMAEPAHFLHHAANMQKSKLRSRVMLSVAIAPSDAHGAGSLATSGPLVTDSSSITNTVEDAAATSAADQPPVSDSQDAEGTGTGTGYAPVEMRVGAASESFHAAWFDGDTDRDAEDGEALNPSGGGAWGEMSDRERRISSGRPMRVPIVPGKLVMRPPPGLPGGNPRATKAVEQCDLYSGKVLRRYESGSVAALAMRVTQSGISLCCNGIKSEAYGFQWRFCDNDDQPPDGLSIETLLGMRKHVREVRKPYNTPGNRMKGVVGMPAGYALNGRESRGHYENLRDPEGDRDNWGHDADSYDREGMEKDTGESMLAVVESVPGPMHYNAESIMQKQEKHFQKAILSQRQQPQVDISPSTVLQSYRLIKLKTELLNILAVLPTKKLVWDHTQSPALQNEAAADIESIADKEQRADADPTVDSESRTEKELIVDRDLRASIESTLDSEPSALAAATEQVESGTSMEIASTTLDPMTRVGEKCSDGDGLLGDGDGVLGDGVVVGGDGDGDGDGAVAGGLSGLNDAVNQSTEAEEGMEMDVTNGPHGSPKKSHPSSPVATAETSADTAGAGTIVLVDSPPQAKRSAQTLRAVKSEVEREKGIEAALEFF